MVIVMIQIWQLLIMLGVITPDQTWPDVRPQINVTRLCAGQLITFMWIMNCNAPHVCMYVCPGAWCQSWHRQYKQWNWRVTLYLHQLAYCEYLCICIAEQGQLLTDYIQQLWLKEHNAMIQFATKQLNWSLHQLKYCEYLCVCELITPSNCEY